MQPPLGGSMTAQQTAAAPDPAELALKLEAYAGIWDSRHDGEIARVLGWDQDAAGEWHQVGDFFGDGLRRTTYTVDLPPFTRSHDAAMMLVPNGWGIRLDRYWIAQVEDPVWSASLTGGLGNLSGDAEDCRSAALALCAAALRALVAIQAGKEISHG